MRILSQTGIVDLPYERIGISRNDTEIVATPIADSNPQERYWTLAEYSTEEKARKAMEMLRVSFENYDWIKSTGNSEELKQVARTLNHDEFKKMTSSYFQFPSDDEVEV